MKSSRMLHTLIILTAFAVTAKSGAALSSKLKSGCNRLNSLTDGMKRVQKCTIKKETSKSPLIQMTKGLNTAGETFFKVGKNLFTVSAANSPCRLVDMTWTFNGSGKLQNVKVTQNCSVKTKLRNGAKTVRIRINNGSWKTGSVVVPAKYDPGFAPTSHRLSIRSSSSSVERFGSDPRQGRKTSPELNSDRGSFGKGGPGKGVQRSAILTDLGAEATPDSDFEPAVPAVKQSRLESGVGGDVIRSQVSPTEETTAVLPQAGENLNTMSPDLMDSPMGGDFLDDEEGSAFEAPNDGAPGFGEGAPLLGESGNSQSASGMNSLSMQPPAGFEDAMPGMPASGLNNLHFNNEMDGGSPSAEAHPGRKFFSDISPDPSEI